jgi:tetratricopeptide (TPR) repeat protein
MLILRIRQAEVAAAAGRLDEACELVTKDGRFRSHRRGQEAITRIIDALVKRGREHLGADRILQAAADYEKAGRLGSDLPEVAQLGIDLRAAQLGRQRGQHDAAVAVATAKRHLEDGELSIGKRVLADVNDSRAKRLMNEIDEQRARFEAAIAAAQSAIARSDWPAAVDAVAKARSIRPDGDGVAETSRQIADVLTKQAAAEFSAGRLDRAGATIATLRQVDPDSVFASDIGRAIEHCHEARNRIEQSRPHEAGESLRRVENLFPKTAWLAEAIRSVTAAAEALSGLRAGPLSLVAESSSATLRPVREPQRKIEEPIRKSPGSQIPERFILQVDGAGAFLVIRSSIAKVGPISSTGLPDVPLIAEATAPVVSIERVEDDYFLRAPSPVSRNDRPVTDTLLATGDRIALSPRCRFLFALPHPASTTAVIDLTGARSPRGDVRRIILLDRDLILGPGPASHVRVNGLTGPVVLNLRNGMLRTSVEATVNGQPLSREAGVPVGVPVVAAGVSFVISLA